MGAQTFRVISALSQQKREWEGDNEGEDAL